MTVSVVYSTIQHWAESEQTQWHHKSISLVFWCQRFAACFFWTVKLNLLDWNDICVCLIYFQTIILLCLRFHLMGWTTPQFKAEDNPAAFTTQLSTRAMTYSYIYAFNMVLLLCPSTLSYDWQMGSVPLLRQLTDVRNLSSLSFFVSLLLITRYCLQRKKVTNLSFATFHKLLVVVVCINANKSSLTQAWQLLFRGPHPPAAFLPPLDSSYWCFRFFLLPTLSVLWVLLLLREFFIFQGAYYNFTFCE